MIDMINQHVLPSVRGSMVAGLIDDKAAKRAIGDLDAGVEAVEEMLDKIHHSPDEYRKASMARQLRLDTMIKVRGACDAVEAIIPADKWTLATYKELQFIDQHTNYK